MKISPEFAYAHTRLQSRFAQLLAKQQWEQLAAARTLPAYLEEVRATGLRPWVAAYSAVSNAHEIERGIRGQFRQCVDDVASWTPNAWRSAVEWVVWLPYLPIILTVLGQKHRPAWMLEDHYLIRFLTSDNQLDRVALIDVGAAPLLEAWERGEALDAAWLRLWRERWPRTATNALLDLEGFTRLLDRHRRQFPRLRRDKTWLHRDHLRVRLAQIFHRKLMQPVNLFVFLCLVAIDLERLRAALVSRALFADNRIG